MKWTFDFLARSLYVYVGDGSSARQVELAGGAVIDLDAADTVVGIEFPTVHASADGESLAGYGLDEITVAMVVAIHATFATAKYNQFALAPQGFDPAPLRETVELVSAQ
jgi:hypothetical protein